MANIKVKIDYPIKDGVGFTFHAPCDCSKVDGLLVVHPGGEQRFTFKDAHGNILTGINNLFGAGSLVKAVLDVTNYSVFLQNADTNGYLEQRLTEIDVMQGRIDELVAMRPAVTELDTCVLSTDTGEGYLDVTLTSNGVTGRFQMLSDTGIRRQATHTSEEYRVPLKFAPMDLVEIEHGTAELMASLWVNEVLIDEGVALVQFSLTNFGDTDESIERNFDTYYPVLYPSIPELADIRVGADGTTYDSAGEAVRHAERGVDQLIDLTTNLDDDVKNLTEKVGNMDVLVVTEAYDTPLFASHTSREINDHVKSGGSVVLTRNGEYYFTLASSTPLEAIFDGTTGDGNKTILWVDVDGKFTSYEYDPTESGADTLVVTYDEDSRMASKNAGEIFQHVSAGGTVVFKRSPGERYVLVHSSEDYATFVCIDDAGYTYVKMIYVDGSLEEYEHDLSSLGRIDPLVVTLDEPCENASHNSAVIYNHVMNGGTAILKEPDGDIHSRLFTLTYVDNSVACFSSFGYDPNAECYEVLDDATVNYYEYHFGESGDVSGQVAEAQAAATNARQSCEEARGYANTAQQSATDAEASAKWAESCSKSAEGSAANADAAAIALMDAMSRIPPEYTENDRYLILRVNGSGDGLEFVNIANDMYIQTWVKPYLLPMIGSGQEGMVLKVVDGKWQPGSDEGAAQPVQTVDTELDPTSLNPIANKPVAQAINRLDETVGDIETALDAVIEMQNRLIFGETIEFTISLEPYTADVNMTWAEWIESEYNTAGFVLHHVGTLGGTEIYNVQTSDGKSVKTDVGGNVQPSDAIIANHAYQVIGL